VDSCRRDRCHLATDVAAEQDGILYRRQLRDLGLDRFDVRTEVRAGRWCKPTPSTVAMFTGALTQRQRWWVALLESGCSAAALDGATALQAAGLINFEAATTISCPHGAKPRCVDGAVIHITEWRHSGDLVNVGIPRVRPETAATRGALWARTDRQAALILIMAVQQRLTTAKRLQWELGRIHRHPRRQLVHELIADLTDGVQALGELDFARMCRHRGLPAPSRQVVRRGSRGRSYLDVYFDDYALVVEIDGIGHLGGLQPVDDALRQNAVSLCADTVLRIPVLGLRVAADAFLDQVADGLVARGWRRAA